MFLWLRGFVFVSRPVLFRLDWHLVVSFFHVLSECHARCGTQ